MMEDENWKQTLKELTEEQLMQKALRNFKDALFFRRVRNDLDSKSAFSSYFCYNKLMYQLLSTDGLLISTIFKRLRFGTPFSSQSAGFCWELPS